MAYIPRHRAIDQISLLSPSDSSSSSLSLGASHTHYQHHLSSGNNHTNMAAGHPSAYMDTPPRGIYHEGLPPEVRLLNPDRNPEVAGLFPVDSTYTSAEERVRRMYQKADIAEQENLTERSMLDVLHQRFRDGKIYTYVSEALLVFNPYKPIPLYGQRDHEAHRGQLSRYDREPHIFYIADKAYQRMLQNRMDQSILVSGESGAGKTETTKHLISHLTYIANQRGSQQTNHMSDLTERITRTNPILEAFGNAETVMNKNSSRFGKMVEITFTGEGDLVGAQILDYLLEKTRVVQQNEGERNFHVFYYLFAGMSQNRLRNYYLDNPGRHSIMATGSDGQLFAGPNGRGRCADMFQEMEAAFRHIGFSEEELDQVYRCLAAILFISDVTFVPDTESNDPYSERIIPAEDLPLEAVSRLLGVSKQRLQEALVSSQRLTNGERVVSVHNETRAVDTRDSLAKALYSLLFGWIIKYINNHLKTNMQLPKSYNIDILDFSGFENFRHNSFEQLCINMANERLQCFFLRQMCLEEQEQYLNEGIQWHPIEVPYNEDRLELFLGRPTGLLELLNDGSRQPNYSDADFVNSLDNHFRQNSTYRNYFERDRTSRTGFSIKHYAANVIYDGAGFLEKNRDNLSPTLRNVMMDSQNEFIKDLFSAEISETGCLSRTRSLIRQGTRGNENSVMRMGQRTRIPSEVSSRSDTGRRAQPTIATFFRASLHEMLTKLEKAEPFFVRCIKPNNNQSPDDFDLETVLNQLRYTGVMQIADIRQRGHPVRVLFADFLKRYKLAVLPLKSQTNNVVQNCQTILLTVATPADYVIGRTKIFMKDYVAERLNQRVERNAAVILQRGMRRLRQKLRQQGRRPSNFKKQTTEHLAGTKEVCFRMGPKPKMKEMSIQVDEEDISQYEELPPQPPPGGDTNSKEDSSDDEADANLAKMPWDIAADIDIEPMSPEEQFRGVMKCFRVFMYIFIFIMVLGSATISQLCLLMLTAGVGINSEANNIKTPGIDYNDPDLNDSAKDARWKRAVLQLLAIICAPRLLTFIFSLVKSLFGHTPWPNARLFCFVMVIETLQTIGETLLVIRVLPRFGTIMSLCMLFSVGLLPSILKMIFWASPEQQRAIDRKGRERQRRKSLKGQVIPPRKFFDSTSVKVLDKLLTFIAFLLQGAGIGFPILVLMYQWNPYWLRGNENQVYHTQSDTWMYWEIPTAMVLTSLKWWENFIHRDRGPFKLARMKQQLFACRQKMTAISSAWSVFVCLIFFYVMEAARGNLSLFKGDLGNILVGNQTYETMFQTGGNSSQTNQTEQPVSKSGHFVLSIIPCLLQIVFACVCYYFCVLACKLMMQKISFVGPLYLSIAASATVVILQCNGILPAFPKETADYVGFTWLCDYSCSSCKDGTLSAWQISLISVAWIVSLLYIAIHVWNYNNEKMAMRERLFVTPFYVGPLVVPSMLMNRRSLDQELRLALNGVDLEYRSFDSYLGMEGIEKEPIVESGRHKKVDEDERPVPKIYACATMWHETDQEIKQLLKSIFRMDMDQCARKIALKKFGIGKSDYYEFETQIFFDDAWQEDPEKKGVFVPNTWVKKFLSVINDAASAVYETEVELPPPLKIPTAYGGRLVWTLPGGNNLLVHMKDKNKIRHKKRWSQVMYMYYLLGWKLLGNDTEKLVKETLKEEKLRKRRKKKEADPKPEANGIMQGKLITRINDQRGKQMAEGVFTTGLTFQEIERKVLRKAENTFILALDGDVDFRPEAVLLLVDRLKRNMKTGAACGRIHPIGAGPMVWYQMFEYAIGHWMQKATEHVFGCVLCSPGCFSLFRGSTLMDTNVMRRYTTKSTEASHFVQYDQGEDRWLCTLIIQQGYRVDYCAGADALTFAPEGFKEFFNQRRRWVTSTLANQLDLMSSYKNTVYINDNISLLFMMYQFLLTVSTILGPATIILAIASAFKEIFQIHVFWSYCLAIIPIAIYIVICHVCKEQKQLIVAGVLSAVYAAVMVVVLVGILKSFSQDDILSPSLFFISILALCFIAGGLLHPYEFFCLAPGVLYYLCIPAGYLILIIYSFSNMHVVSWGTRESPKPVNVQEKAKEEKEKQNKPSRILAYLRLDQYYKDFKKTIMQAFSNKDTNKLQQEQIELLQQLNKNIKKVNRTLKGGAPDSDEEEKKVAEPMAVIKYATKTRKPKPQEIEVQEVFEEDPMRPEWAISDIPEGPISYLPSDEAEFWDDFIRKYVKPLKDSPNAKARLQSQLIELRNNLSFAVWFINGLWVVFNYMMDLSLPPIPVGSYKTPPLGFCFLAIFFLLLILQLIGMFVHRWGTFLQLISNTELPNPWRKSHKNFESRTVEEAIRVTKEMQRRRTVLDESEAEHSLDFERAAKKTNIHSFLSKTLRGRKHGWSANLRKSSRQWNNDYGDEDVLREQRPLSPFDTISRGVALSLRRQQRNAEGSGSFQYSQEVSRQNSGPPLPRRYLRHDELERRFEKRYRTLSRRYRNFPFPQQNMDIEVIDI